MRNIRQRYLYETVSGFYFCSYFRCIRGQRGEKEQRVECWSSPLMRELH